MQDSSGQIGPKSNKEWRGSDMMQHGRVWGGCPNKQFLGFCRKGKS